MSQLTKIRNAGFTLELDDGDFVVEPFSKLTESQRAFLKSHKAEIIGELKQEQLVTCWTPNGTPIQVVATSPEHAEFLRRMNPQPPKGTHL